MQEPHDDRERPTHMQRHAYTPLRRLAALAGAAALVLGACGSGDDDTLPAPSDTADHTSGELRAPTPIEVVGGVAPGDAASAAAIEADAAVSEPAILPIGDVEYEVVDGLPPLPSDDTGFVYEAGAEPTVDRIAALADALGVEGDVVADDDGVRRSWRVGPDDGSAPTLYVWGDAIQAWSYSGPWSDETVVRCVTPASPAGEPVDPDGAETGEATDEPDAVVVDECPTPEPPSGVPTASEAESLAADLLTRLGVTGTDLEFETDADDWFATVTAWDAGDDLGRARQWNLGFGGDAVLTDASGSLAEPAPVGPYPLIDLDQALERLNDGGFWFGGGVLPGIATSGVAEPAIAEAPPEDLAGEASGDEPMPVEPDVEPQSITVTLTDVESDLWWAWDAEGNAWLLPAYRFVDVDGGRHVVPAVTDEFLIRAEPDVVEPAPEPAPADPDPDVGPDSDIDPDEVAGLVGRPLPEFTAAAEALGLVVRVVEIDGEPLAVTEEYLTNRINVAIVTVDDVEQVVRAQDDGGRVIAEVSVEPAEPGAGAVQPDSTVHEGVEFYPACGNETLVHEGVTWYQVTETHDPVEWERVVEIPRGGLESELLGTHDGAAPSGFGGGLRVAEPGPGDDVGTLTVWADGIAHWVSDSGDLDVWLTTTEITYDWVC